MWFRTKWGLYGRLTLYSTSRQRRRILFSQVSRSHQQSQTRHSPKSCYKILSLRYDATPEQIKAAFYRKSKEHHPDSRSSHSTDGTEFHKICIAYETLKNPKTRHEHDRMLGVNQRPREHKYDAEYEAPKAWRYAHEEPSEYIPMKEKISLLLFLLVVSATAIFIIKYELSRRRKTILYHKRTGQYDYGKVPPILKNNSASRKLSIATHDTDQEHNNLDKNSLDDLRTWK